jgi:uncharacterized membrane protein YobD (UPF0266 family)
MNVEENIFKAPIQLNEGTNKKDAITQLLIILQILKLVFYKLKSALVLIYQNNLLIMGNIFFLLSNINEINFSNEGNLLNFANNYRKLLQIINKNDKEELESFIKTNYKIDEICSKVYLYDSSKRTILNYIASNSGKL